jgi:hypothetical protein
MPFRNFYKGKNEPEAREQANKGACAAPFARQARERPAQDVENSL